MKKEKKRKTGWVFVFAIVGILLMVWCYGMTKIYDKMHYIRISSLEEKNLKENGCVNILLIGSDSRASDTEGRSDAMILLSISSRTHTIQATSFLRDMYVDIPGHDGNRLNAAYAFGGPQLLMQTIEENFDIPVNRYIVVNFEAFASLVDAVGGVTLNLSNEEVKWVNAYLNEFNLLQGLPIDTGYLDESLSGEIHLTGPQALAYTRNRYIGSDFGRTGRQREVLSAIVKALPKAALKDPKGLVNGIFPNLTTNLSRGEFIALSFGAWKGAVYSFEQGMIPTEGSFADENIRGMAVLRVDLEKNKEYLKEKLYNQ